MATLYRALWVMIKNLDYIKCARETVKWFSPETMILSTFHFKYIIILLWENRKYAKSNQRNHQETIIRPSFMGVGPVQSHSSPFFKRVLIFVYCPTNSILKFVILFKLSLHFYFARGRWDWLLQKFSCKAIVAIDQDDGTGDGAR